MTRSPRPRETANLSHALHQRLNAYTLAASAAGVSILAFNNATEAKIIYTKTNLKFGPNSTLLLDLNHDGIIDFELVARISPGRALLRLEPSPKNDVYGTYRLRYYLFASALYGGASIGPKGHFFPKNRAGMAYVFNSNTHTSSYFYGPWTGQPGHRTLKDRYLGFRFRIKGKIHFGWARLNVTSAGYPTGIVSTLTGYAYESIPGKSIKAGQTKGPHDNSIEAPSASLTGPTPTLGMLALGSPALSIWRKEDAR